MNRLDMSASDVLNFETLVKLRFLHQTKQAHTGIRKTAGQSAQTTETMTQRQSLARRFNAVIKEQQERGISTGSERDLRWTRDPAPGGRDGIIDGVIPLQPAAGNAANAKEVASNQAKKVSS